MTTTRCAIRKAERRIAAAGARRPAADAATLAAHAWGTTPDRLTELLDDPVPEIYWRFVDRKIAREPVERITGTAVFWGRPFEVHPDVFVPKPETERLVVLALDYLASLDAPAPRVVDLCTGSGAVAISIATSSPGARVYGADLSQSACELSRRNAAGLDVQVECADAAAAFPELDAAVDLVVSNPPYFPADREVRLPEVRDHDPELALWAGTDGLDVIRSVEHAARRLLVPGGLVLVEHGAYQVAEVTGLFSEAGSWSDVAGVQTVNHSVLTARRRALNRRASTCHPRPTTRSRWTRSCWTSPRRSSTSPGPGTRGHWPPTSTRASRPISPTARATATP